MSNFSGYVRKNANSFKPQQRASDGAGVGKATGGLWPGQDPIVVFEKADQPVLDTTPTPRTDGRGEGEIGLSGSVNHPDNDGGAKYLASKLGRVYRRIMSDGVDIENLSTADRRKLADELVRSVYDGDGQHPSGEAGSTSQTNTLAYIRQVAAVLFGLADELPGTPTFLTRSDSGGFLQKMEGGEYGTDCPHCHKVMRLDLSAVSPLTGVGTFTCPNCSKKWDGNPSLMLRKEAPAEPTLADVKTELNKQVAILTERLRGLIAHGAGFEITERSGSGRFVTKGKTVAEQELHKALANGRPAEFKGEIVKSGFVPAETGEQRNRDAAAREALGKSLANSVNIDQAIRK